MRFAAVHLLFLRSDVASRASNAAPGGWVRLYGRAAELETGGVLLGVKANDDRAWLIAAGVTVSDVSAAVSAGLCEWRGEDLLVLGYDQQGQETVEARRKNGRRGGRPVSEPTLPGVGMGNNR